MVFCDENSWKKKIDPSFDNLIKVHLDYINQIGICHHVKDKKFKKYTRYMKYLKLDEKSLKVLKHCGYPSLLRESKMDRRKLRKLINHNIALGASSDSMLILEFYSNIEKLFKNESKKKPMKNYEEKYLDAIESNITDMINGLPWEDSKDYYRERFAVDLSVEEFIAVVESKTDKELLKFFVDIKMDLNCLIYQTGFRGYWDSAGEDFNNKSISKLKMINMGMLQVYNAISLMTYKKSLGVLYTEARKNGESLCNAIHLDKTLLDKPWVRKRINEAFYSGKTNFLRELGKSIGKPPINVKIDYGELMIILISLWPFGLYRLDNEELLDLFKMCRVPRQDNTASFTRYINRLKKSGVLIDIYKCMKI
jgi:hypothetical protein